MKFLNTLNLPTIIFYLFIYFFISISLAILKIQIQTYWYYILILPMSIPHFDISSQSFGVSLNKSYTFALRIWYSTCIIFLSAVVVLCYTSVLFESICLISGYCCQNSIFSFCLIDWVFGYIDSPLPFLILVI